MVLKSKFIQHQMCVINYTVIIGKSKYFVFIEFLKFGLGSKEERSYWKKTLYITLVARHFKFERALRGKKLPYFEKKNRIRTIKAYLISKGKKGYMMQKRFNVHHRRLGKKIINTNFKEFVQKKFKEVANGLDLKARGFDFRGKIQKPKEIIKPVIFKLKNFPDFYMQVEIFGLYSQKNKISQGNLNLINVGKKEKKMPIVKKLKFTLKKKFFKKKSKKKNKKLNVCVSLGKFSREFGKIIVRSNYQNFLNIGWVANQNIVSKKNKNISKVKPDSFGKKFKQKLNRFGFEIPIIYNLKPCDFKNYIIKKKALASLCFKKFERNDILFAFSLTKKDFTGIHKKEFQRPITPKSEFLLLQALKRKKVNAYRANKIIGFGQKVWLRKSYKKLLEYTTLRGGHFDDLTFPEPTLFSFGGGPRKRLSRNLKRTFKSKGIKKLISLIWFWEKIARMLSYVVFRYKEYMLFVAN